MATENHLSFSQFQFVLLLVKLCGEQMQGLTPDKQHDIAVNLFNAWDMHDAVFRDFYEYPMNDTESMQDWFQKNSAMISRLIVQVKKSGQ